MRTDVKLGLAVGSILFSVVLVYVLFFTSGTKPPVKPGVQNEVAVKTPADQPATPSASEARPSPAASPAPEATVSITPGTPAAAPAAPAPSTLDISTPPATPAASPAPMASATPAATPATPAPGSETPAPAAPRDWSTLLSNGTSSPNGELVARSETPMPGAVRMEMPAPIIPAPAATEIVAPPSTQPVGAGTVHRVKAGETLWSIAGDYYGNPAYHGAIAKANPKVNPNQLKAGTPLNIPNKSEVVTATPVMPAAAPATQPIDPARQYIVQPGDNLNTICKRLYGNTARVPQLYELNKAKIGPNPSNLKLRMVLQLPEAPTRAPGAPSAPGTAASTSGNTLAGSIH